MNVPVHRRMWKFQNLTNTNSKGVKGGPFVSSIQFCDHCANNGYVILDRTDAAAPCPMCTLGMLRHKAFAPEGAPSSERFWSVWDWRVLTWEGGLTPDHWKCYECKTFLTQPIDEHKAECADLQASSRSTLVSRRRMMDLRLERAAKDASIDRQALLDQIAQEKRNAEDRAQALDLARKELADYNRQKQKAGVA